jgi:RHS repeat-associated protein
VNYTYDALNRLLTVKYPAASIENVTYSYDDISNGSYGIGRLTGVVNSGAGITYRYNYLGLISQKITLLNGITSTTSYTYDAAGNLSGIVYPSGRIVTYTRDLAGRILSVKTKETAAATEQTIVNNVSYLPFGPAKSFSFGNGLTHSATYDNDYRLNAIQVGSLFNRGYGYDAVDNITSITNLVAATKNQTFGYDALNRLTNATGIYGTLAYSYDPVGNRLTETRGSATDTYIYAPTSNRLNSVTRTSGNRSFTYDAAGNRITGTADDNKAQAYTYNKANRLETTKVTNVLVGTYNYNALGQRVKKIAGSNTELYHYDESGQLIAVTDATGKKLREYIYNGNQLVSFANSVGTPIASITLTAAAATKTNAVLSTAQTGYTGATGYIQFNGTGQVSWPLSVVHTANYNITLRYSMTGVNRPLTLWVDGVQKATINFTATANLNTWANVINTQNLTAGNHTIILKSGTASGPNLDKVTVAAAAGQTGPLVTSLYYVHNDHLGTPQVVTAQNQSVAWMADYQPFGKLQPGQVNSIELYSRFPGQFLDTETGLYYNYFRDYDPSIGRYIESDPIGLDGGINTYAYVGGNPLSFVDPKGKSWVVIVVPAVAVAVVVMTYSNCVEKCKKQKDSKCPDDDSTSPGKSLGECAKRCKPFLDLGTAPLSPDDIAAEAAKAAGEASRQ